MEGYFAASYRTSNLSEIHPSDLETQNEIDKLSVQLLEQYYEYRNYLVKILKETDTSVEQVNKIDLGKSPFEKKLSLYGMDKYGSYTSGEVKEKQRLKLTSKLIEKRKKDIQENKKLQEKYEQEQSGYSNFMYEQINRSKAELEQPRCQISERISKLESPKKSENILINDETSIGFLEVSGKQPQKKSMLLSEKEQMVKSLHKPKSKVLKRSMIRKQNSSSALKKSQLIKLEQNLPQTKKMRKNNSNIESNKNEAFSPEFPSNKNNTLFVSQFPKNQDENSLNKASSKSLKKSEENSQGLLSFTNEKEQQQYKKLIQNRSDGRKQGSLAQSKRLGKSIKLLDSHAERMMKMSTYLDTQKQNVELQLQHSRVLMISERVQNVLEKSNSQKNSQSSSEEEDDEIFEIIQEKQDTTIEQIFLNNIQRMLSQLCNLYSLGQCYKYLLKNKQYQIFTKLYKLADEKGIDEIEFLSVEVLKKGMRIILREEDKFKVSYVLDKMFQKNKNQISYEEFGQMFKATINEQEFKWFSNKQLDSDSNRTLQFLRRLLIIYLQIDYFERKMRKIMKINSGYISLFKQKITFTDKPHLINVDKLQKYIYQTLLNRVNRRKIELYFSKKFKLDKVEQFISWVYSLK